MAKKKQNKVTIKALEDAVKDSMNEIVTIEWRGLEIEVKRFLPLNSMMAFVEYVSNACFGTDAKYNPEVKDFVFRSLVVQMYTNMTLPSDLSKSYDILFQTDLFTTLLNTIDYDQLDSIIRAIEMKTAYLCNSNVNLINKQMVDATRAFEDLAKQMQALTDGISQEDIANISKAFANGGIDPEKLMQAYMTEKYPEAQVTA